ncbi:MAG: PP2C family protein-serine/threonine phosphatase [Clostridia bacterium]|nr:PP2C family protein-serine/threonine phosphatase [Clostridia bacterium]
MAGFTVSPGNMINIIMIAAGIGICGMIILLVSSGTQLRKQVTRYFQLFFSIVILYIGSHLVRQLLEGQPGPVVHYALYGVTLLEFLASGAMAFLFSGLTLFIAAPEKGRSRYTWLFIGTLVMHAVLMIVSQFISLCYYFDADNLYHRAPGYLLSNLAHVIMLIGDVFLLIRYRGKFSDRIRPAFWAYIVAPLAAILLQAFTHDVQFIILATVAAAVYMSLSIMRDQMEKYEKQQEVTNRLSMELNMATAIQASQLPRLFPAFPNRPEFEVYASMKPAKEVGGDFYDFFLIDNDHIGLVMADVSGKGVPAALFMMVARVLIKAHLQNGENPAEALENVNNQLCESNEAQLFVTVWAAVLEISTGKGVAANAGHEHPAIRRAGGEYALQIYRHSPAVATMDGIPVREHSFQLNPGDTLFVYTDGVAEATNANNELFGSDRMLDALNTDPDAQPEEVLANVMRGIDTFVAGAEQFDDITMLCLKYDGPAKSGEDA